MAELTKQQLIDKLALLITSNGNKENTANRVRDVLSDVIDSAFNTTDDSALLTSGGVVVEYSPARAGGYAAKVGFLIEGNLWLSNVIIAQGTDLATAKTLSTQKTFNASTSDYGFVAWQNADPYIIGSKVEDENKLYKSLSINQGSKPKNNPLDWVEVSANDGSFGNVWVAGYYLVDQVVTNPNNDILYKVVSDFQSVNITAEISTNFEVFHDVGSSISGTQYFTTRFDANGDLVESDALINNGVVIDIKNLIKSKYYAIKNDANNFIGGIVADVTEARAYRFPDKNIMVAGIEDVDYKQKIGAGITFIGNGTVTVMPLLMGEWSSISNTQPIIFTQQGSLFTSVGNVLTYVGVEPIKRTITAAICMANAQSGTRKMEIAIFKNGSPIAEGSSVQAIGGGFQNIFAMLPNHPITVGDYFEIKIRGVSGSTRNMVIEKMNLIID